MKIYYRLVFDYRLFSPSGLKEQQEYLWSRRAEGSPVNLPSEVYLENKEDVITLLQRLIYINGIEWCGEKGIQERIRRNLKDINQMLDDVGVKFSEFGVDGRAVTIYKIVINDVDTIIDSPLLNCSKRRSE